MQPVLGKSLPSGERRVKLRIPPGRRSISQCVVVHGLGANQWTICSGLVQAAQTSSRGTSTTRSRTRSSFGSGFHRAISFLLECDEVGIELIEAFFPEVTLVDHPVFGE